MRDVARICQCNEKYQRLTDLVAQKHPLGRLPFNDDRAYDTETHWFVHKADR